MSFKRTFSQAGLYQQPVRTVSLPMGYAPRVGRFTTRRKVRRGKGLKSVVAKAIHRIEEKKESNIYSLNTNLPPVNNAGWTASSIRLSPGTGGFSIPQGTGQGTRIGNKIRVSKAWVKGVIHPLPYDAGTNPNPLPQEVRMLIFKDKFKSTEQPAAVALDLFQQGSTSIGPQNDLVDTILDPNRDRYQIYHDQVLKVGYASANGTGGVPGQQFSANNDFSYNVKYSVDITNFLPKNIIYNDADADPMSDGLWMIFLPVAANGLSLTASTVNLTQAWTANLEFTDA